MTPSTGRQYSLLLRLELERNGSAASHKLDSIWAMSWKALVLMAWLVCWGREGAFPGRLGELWARGRMGSAAYVQGSVVGT